MCAGGSINEEEMLTVSLDLLVTGTSPTSSDSSMGPGSGSSRSEAEPDLRRGEIVDDV